MASTVLEIIQAVTNELSLPQPSIAVSSQDLTVRQLVALSQAAVDELVEMFDWQALLKTHTFQTVPSQTLYNLPSDFARLVGNTVWDRGVAFPISGSHNPQTFQSLQSGIFKQGPYYRFRVIGDRFELLPTPESVTTVAFNYISSNAVRSAVGTEKQRFTADDDTTIFRNRLVTNFVKLKLLQVKGFDTSVAVQDFNTSYNAAIGQDVPSGALLMAQSTVSPLLNDANVPDGSWG